MSKKEELQKFYNSIPEDDRLLVKDYIDIIKSAEDEREYSQVKRAMLFYSFGYKTALKAKE